MAESPGIAGVSILPICGQTPVSMVPVDCVDAFAASAFSGNPAAVCLLEHTAPPAWMQRLAGEMNLSETASLVPEADAFALRWSTPEAEVDLGGHAVTAWQGTPSANVTPT